MLSKIMLKSKEPTSDALSDAMVTMIEEAKVNTNARVDKLLGKG